MKKILTGALAALTVGGVALGGASEASARGWGPGPGAAVVAGIAGLAVGAAIASNQPYYAPAPVYYAAPPPAYYAGPAYYGYVGRCRAEWRWSPRWGHYERVRACF
ncbi:MAG TPA: hypothetical protein VHX64_02730 [Caulobacteraceae bacterium]|nr:hypothetical protein [Caulobacteraceae bacterium]